MPKSTLNKKTEQAIEALIQRWGRSSAKAPIVRLQLDGIESAIVADVHEAFRMKYPKRSAMFRSLGVSTNTVIHLNCKTHKGT